MPFPKREEKNPYYASTPLSESLVGKYDLIVFAKKRNHSYVDEQNWQSVSSTRFEAGVEA